MRMLSGTGVEADTEGLVASNCLGVLLGKSLVTSPLDLYNVWLTTKHQKERTNIGAA